MHDLRHSFPGQARDEAVFVFARPYFVAFLPTILLYAVVMGFSATIQLMVSGGQLGITDGFSANLIVLGLGIFSLMATVVFFVALLDFYFDIFIVTDRRIVDIDQEKIFFRRISELSLDEVQDATSVVSGVLPTLFDYGTVHVQTAGTTAQFEMTSVLLPREIAAIVVNLSQQAKEDLPDNTRYPDTAVVGAINNRTVASLKELAGLGAIDATDPRVINPPPHPHAPKPPGA